MGINVVYIYTGRQSICIIQYNTIQYILNSFKNLEGKHSTWLENAISRIHKFLSKCPTVSCEVPQSLLQIEAVVITLVCLPELDVMILLLKIPHNLVITYVKLSWV